MDFCYILVMTDLTSLVLGVSPFMVTAALVSGEQGRVCGHPPNS